MPAPQDVQGLHTLEAAAFAAWPALHTCNLEGWQLRLADGYTQRANSANAIAQVDELPLAQILAVEAHYAAQGQPSVFRLASFCTTARTDAALAERGYRYHDVSLVMAADLADANIAATASPARCHFLADAAEWLVHYQAISGAKGPGQATHLRMLRAIAHPCGFAVIQDGAGRPLCCGLGVVVGSHLGLFDIVTRPDHRQQGLGEALCRSLMAWGRLQGAGQAFLQVVAANAGAVHLYERLGFRRRYHYWYRSRPTV
jgi:ribosomal protein S18 acetylase RimI-like enzyme